MLFRSIQNTLSDALLGKGLGYLYLLPICTAAAESLQEIDLLPVEQIEVETSVSFFCLLDKPPSNSLFRCITKASSNR